MKLMNPPMQDISIETNSFDNDGINNARTYIARLIVKIRQSLNQILGYTITDDEHVEMLAKMELISIFIHESMSIGSRNYHSVQHVFDILSSSTDAAFRKDPIATLAAIFHDCVYYNIDGGFTKLQQDKLQNAYDLVVSDDASNTGVIRKLKVHSQANDDPLLRMVLQIFGMEPDQELNPMGGQNEYLSAVIAVRELSHGFQLPMEVLVQIAVSIEATIPFRRPDPASPMERLYTNLCNTVAACHIQLSKEECIAAVQRAVLLTNEDVSNFCSDDLGWFLDNTWSLLPESNIALRQPNSYTVQEFQFAVYKMYGFFSFLQPQHIFQKFQGVPSDEEWTLRTDRAKQNLILGKQYIAAKLLSISVIAAIAELTGGDAPLSLFVGDLPTRNRTSHRLEDSLLVPNHTDNDSNHNSNNVDGTSTTSESLVLVKDSACPSNCNPIVYKILANGRSRDTVFDVKQSPLAAYFYYYLGDDKVDAIFNHMAAKKISLYPMNSTTAKEFLLLLPSNIVQYVTNSIAQLAISRSNRIHTVIKELYNTTDNSSE